VTTEMTYGDVPREGELVDMGEVAPPRASGAKRARPYVVRRRTGPHRALVAAGLLAAVAVLWWGGHIGQFNQGQLTRVMIYAIAIAGLNIATGYTGMVSVGHSAFFGLGAYTTGILMTEAGWRAEYTIPVALAVCFVAGLVVGLPALRIRGLYLAVVTLAFGVAFPEIIGRFPGLTGGTQGLTISFDQLRPPTWTGYTLGQQGLWLYWLSAAVLVIVMVIIHNLVRSRFGLAMMAARDNEIAASSSGVDLAAVKVLRHLRSPHRCGGQPVRRLPRQPDRHRLLYPPQRHRTAHRSCHRWVGDPLRADHRGCRRGLHPLLHLQSRAG
jgi:branched-chain amino acid transport system permease protein